MRRLALAALLAAAIGSTSAVPARACDPYWDWEWCFGWYGPEPVPYESSWSEPAYEPYIDDRSWAWWEPTFISEPVVAYETPVAPVAVVPPPAPAPTAAPAPAPITYAPAPAPVAVAYAPPPMPAPIWIAPIVDVLPAWEPPPTPTPAPTPQPAPAPRQPDVIAADLGLHRVTDVWVGDVVTTQGAVTTYTTSTVQQDAGTYATLVASVGTGEGSSYDALLSNGRMSLTDGRPVKGDIYASYVWTGSEIVLDRYVFFQDDLEVARLRTSPSQAAVASPGSSAGPAPSVGDRGPQVAAGPAYVAAPIARPAPGSADTTTTVPGPSPTPFVPRLVRAGVALSPQGDMLGRIEVLRGRRVDLWPRATVDGVPARVDAWSLASGEAIALGPLQGGADEPFAATWDRLAPLGTPFLLRFEVTVDLPGIGPRIADATIEVIVRSPALVE